MRTIEQIQKNIKRKIKSGLNLKEPNKVQKTVHFEDKKKTPTETQINEVINLEKKLRKTYKVEVEKKLNNELEKQKAFEPITTGLKNIEQAVRKTDDDIRSFLVPVRPLTQTTEFISKQQKMIQNRDIEPGIKNSIVNREIGTIAEYYLPKLTDNKFGLYHNNETSMFMVGKNNILLRGNDLDLNGQVFKGTQGLWRLLTYNRNLDKSLYTDEDFKNYEKILLETDSLYQNNDKNTNKVKSSKGEKYTNMIAPIWKKINESKKTQTVQGSGLINYTENPIQYKYIENLNELLKRLYFISSEERAGNNNFHNEKLGIINFVSKEMEKLVDTPRGIEYLISFVTSLPKKVIRGSGLVNNFLNSKFMPEIHWPGYNYLGPFTESKKKKPKNKLDEAAMNHDFFYERHKDTKSRHKADLTLENIAKNIYKDPETPLGEKTAAFATSNIMHLKRRLGMGLI